MTLDARMIILIGGVVLLGFLLYPRSEESEAPEALNYITTVKELPQEELHYPRAYKSQILKSYDLGFVYRIDKVLLELKNPEQGPRQFDLIGSIERDRQYDRIYTYKSTSSEFPFGVLRFEPAESRWVQLVINEWFGGRRPDIKNVSIGAAYQHHGPIVSVSSRYDLYDLPDLIDGLVHENSKWLAARRKIKEEKKGETQIIFETVKNDVEVIFDLGIITTVLGTRITTDGPGNNLARYSLSVSLDGRSYRDVYSSPELPDKTIGDIFTAPENLAARYVKLTIPKDGVFGDYAEIREVEIFTPDYRLPEKLDISMDDYNAVQAYNEDCGRDGLFSPHLISGFAFDRGRESDPKIRYMLAEGDEVEPGLTDSQRSFAYHYDSLVFVFNNLEPTALYWLVPTYLQEKNGSRYQRMLVDGYILHDGIEVPKGTPQTLTLPVPKDAYADGKLKVEIQRLAGPNAVISELALFEARPAGAKQHVITRSAKSPKIPAFRPIKVDGDLGDWTTIYPLVADGYKSARESPVTCYSGWDENNLYFAFVVDRNLFPMKSRGIVRSKSLDRSFDTLDLFIDSTANASPGMYTESDHHIRVSQLSPRSKPDQVYVSQIHHHKDSIPKTIFDRKEIEFAFRSGKNRYTLEMRIPKGEVIKKLTPDYDRVLGLNYVLRNELIDPIYWENGDIDSPPASWGRLRLVSSISGSLIALSPDGTDQISSINSGEAILIALRDTDPNADPRRSERVKVTVSGDIGGDREEIELTESQIAANGSGMREAVDSDLFVSSLLTEFGETPVPGDGKLSVRGGEKITITYVDPFYSQNERNMPVSYQLSVNIGNSAKVVIVDENGTEIDWFKLGDEIGVQVHDPDLQTDQEKVSLVVEETGEREELTLARNDQVFSGKIKTAFSDSPTPDNGILEMMGLQTVKASYLDAIQNDGRTNVVVSSTARVEIGDSATIGVQIVTEDGAQIDSNTFRAGDRLLVTVQDKDLNVSPDSQDQATVTVTGDQLNDSITLTLKEVGLDSGRFIGELATEYATEAKTDDPMLQVRGNENVEFLYIDSIMSSGARDGKIVAQMSVEVGDDGRILLVRSNYIRRVERFNAGDTLYLRLEDSDEESPIVEVRVMSETTGDRLSIPLIRSGTNVNLFMGSFGTEFSSEPRDDSLLQVIGGEEIRVVYTDKLRSSGQTNVDIPVKARVNTGNTGILKVSRKERTDGVVDRFRAGETLIIEVEDFDLSVTDVAAQLFEITARNETNGDVVSGTMREVSGGSGIFRGEVKTEFGTVPIMDDSILQVQGGDVVGVTYVDVIQDDGRPNVEIVSRLQVETGVTGRIELVHPDTGKGVRSFSAGSSITVRVTDADLNLSADTIEAVGVNATGNLVGDELLLTLIETGEDSSVFLGTLRTEYAESPDFTDSVLQVSENELITIDYLDPITATGETSVDMRAFAIISSSSSGKLIITDANRREIGEFRPGITLFIFLEDLLLDTLAPTDHVDVTMSSTITNDLATVTLTRIPDERGVFFGSIPTRYGTTPVYDDYLDVQGGELVIATYRQNLPGVFNEPISDSAYVSKGNRGELRIVRSDGVKVRYFDPGTPLYFTLADPDLDLDPTAVDEASIWVTTEQGESRLVMLRETAESSGIFGGKIGTAYGRQSDQTVLGVTGGERVNATYRDPIIDTGQTNVDITDFCHARKVGWANFAQEPIIIDGIADGWPLETVMRTPQNEAMMWAQWDEEFLYILVQVYDRNIEVKDVSRWYEDADAVEIHLDFNPASSEEPYYLRPRRSNSRYVLWFCPTGAGPNGTNHYAGQYLPQTFYNYSPPIEMAVRYREDYYNMEIKIPIRIVFPGFDPLKTSTMRKIGFNFVVYRSDMPPVWWIESDIKDSTLLPSDLGILKLITKEEAARSLGSVP